MIADILERYVKDPRHTRSGFPDLTLWNTDTKAFKVTTRAVVGQRCSIIHIYCLKNITFIYGEMLKK